jgi:hypothetical protein
MSAGSLASSRCARELAGLDASRPPQQTDIDGWLIRLSPGKATLALHQCAARRALPLDELLARCQRALTPPACRWRCA